MLAKETLDVDPFETWKEKKTKSVNGDLQEQFIIPTEAAAHQLYNSPDFAHCNSEMPAYPAADILKSTP